MDGMERVAKLRAWTDADGVEWVRHGDKMDPKRVARLMLDPAVKVLRFGLPEPAEVGPMERDEYWQRIEPYVRGTVRRAAGEKTNDHFDCEVTEFRNAERRTLVTVYESC